MLLLTNQKRVSKGPKKKRKKLFLFLVAFAFSLVFFCFSVFCVPCLLFIRVLNESTEGVGGPGGDLGLRPGRHESLGLLGDSCSVTVCDKLFRRFLEKRNKLFRLLHMRGCGFLTQQRAQLSKGLVTEETPVHLVCFKPRSSIQEVLEDVTASGVGAKCVGERSVCKGCHGV